MKKTLSRAISILLAVILLIATVPFGAVAETPVSFTEEFTSAEDFATKWETVKSEATSDWKELNVAHVTTDEDVYPGALTNAAYQNKTPDTNVVTTVKDSYWPGNSTNKIQSVTAEVYIPQDATFDSAVLLLGYVDKDNYLGLNLRYGSTDKALQYRFISKTNGIESNIFLKNAQNGKVVKLYDSEKDVYVGKFTVRVNYEYTNRGVVYPDLYITDEFGNEDEYKANRSSTVSTVAIWPKGTYTVNASNKTVFTEAELDSEGNYIQSFDGSQKIGLTHSKNKKPIYVNNFTCTFENSAEAYIGIEEEPEEPPVDEPTAEELAAEFKAANQASFDLTVIEDADDLALVNATLTAYEALDGDVKTVLADDIAELNTLKTAYEAEEAAKAEAAAYKDTYKTTLAITKIRSEEANALVDTAIEAYNALSEAAQAKLGAEIETLNALKAEYAEFLAKVYTPEIKGATIRRQGTQTIGYKCQINNLREDLEVVEYGMIVTANSFIQEGLVAEEDLTLGGLNDYVRAVSSDDVASIVEGAEIIANIGNVSSNNYGVRYVVRVYIKYKDGTVDYSNVLGRSVIGVAKSIAAWTFNNDVQGLATPITDIIKNANEDGTNIEYAYDVKTDNGVKILEYLEANNDVIAAALKG